MKLESFGLTVEPTATATNSESPGCKVIHDFLIKSDRLKPRLEEGLFTACL